MAALLLLAGIQAAGRQAGKAAVGGRGSGRRMMMVRKEGKVRGGRAGHAALLLSPMLLLMMIVVLVVVVRAGPRRMGSAGATSGSGGRGGVHGAFPFPAVRVQLLLLVRQNLINNRQKRVKERVS